MSNIDQTPVNAGAEVTVEPQNTQGAAQTADVATGTPEGKQSQSKEENATFAAMRRQYEQQLTECVTRLAGLDAIAKKAGHESVERMLLAQRATEMGLSIEEMENQELEEEQSRKQAVLDSPEYKEMAEKVKAYEDSAVEKELTRRMEADLSAIQKVFPEVKTLEELGAVYTAAISAGVEPVQAARAAKAVQMKPPENIGAAGKSAPPVSDHFTEADIEYYESHPKEMAKLTDEQFARLRRDMAKL